MPADRVPAESEAFVALRHRVASALVSGAPQIAARWERQSREVALRPADGTGATPSAAIALVEAIAAALTSEGGTALDAVPLGLSFGAEAFERGASLHHTVKGLDLLSAMVLFAVERAVAAEQQGSVADGVRLGRRLQTSASLLTLAATKGYTQAVSDSLRDRFRHLRHDLRNPLGNIKSVLSLMDDETLPADARTSPRFRAMAQRNARSLDDMIMARLSDAAALLPALAHQLVSLRTVACAVRRDLRAEAESRDATIGVSEEVVRARVDAVGLELLLRELLQAALDEAREGDELMVEFPPSSDARADVCITVDPPRPPVTAVAPLEALSLLARRMGANLVMGDRIVVSLPVLRPDAEAPAAAAP